MKQQRAKKLPSYPGSTALYGVLTVLILGETIAIIAQAYFLARAITFLFQRMPITDLWVDIGLFFVAFVIRHILAQIEMSVAEKYATKTATKLRNDLVKMYFQQNISFIQQKGTGYLVTLVMEGIDHVKKYLEIIGIRMIKTIIIPIFIVIYVFFYDPISSVILVVTVPIVIIFMILLGLAAEKLADRQYETYKRLSNHFIDSLKGLETLSYLGKSREHAHSIESVNTDYRKATMHTLRVAFLSSFALDFFTSLSIAFVAVGLGLRLIDGDIVLLPALTILILAPEYFSPIKQVGKDYHATLDGQIAMTEIDQFLKGDKSVHHERKQIIKWNSSSTISFQNVLVKTNDKERLKNVTFETATKGMIGIIGVSGAGKSTLIHVLAGRLKPDKGVIQIDGKSLDSLYDEEWFQQIAYIPQHPYIFPLSIADNIRFYAPDTSDEKVQNIIDRIGLSDFVATLPNGINEKIGEGARILSGGQEQRIAIARALVSNKQVILLDEPTAHLDIETEYEIKQLILEVFKDKLVFLATHRLHWMKQMDSILMMEEGKIIEQGTHEQLVVKDSKYVNFIHWKRENTNE